MFLLDANLRCVAADGPGVDVFVVAGEVFAGLFEFPEEGLRCGVDNVVVGVFGDELVQILEVFA